MTDPPGGDVPSGRCHKAAAQRNTSDGSDALLPLYMLEMSQQHGQCPVCPAGEPAVLLRDVERMAARHKCSTVRPAMCMAKVCRCCCTLCKVGLSSEVPEWVDGFRMLCCRSRHISLCLVMCSDQIMSQLVPDIDEQWKRCRTGLRLSDSQVATNYDRVSPSPSRPHWCNCPNILIPDCPTSWPRAVLIQHDAVRQSMVLGDCNHTITCKLVTISHKLCHPTATPMRPCCAHQSLQQRP